MFHFLLIAKHLKDGTLTPKDLLDTTIIALLFIAPIVAYYGFGLDQMYINYLLKETASQYATSVRMVIGVTPLCLVYIFAVSIYNIVTGKKAPKQGK